MHGHNEIILLYNFNDITVMKNIFSWFRRVHYNRFWQYAFAILVCFFFSTLIFIPHRYFYSNDLYSPARLFVCSLTDRSKIISARSLSKKSFNGGENVTEENQDHFGSIKNVRNIVNDTRSYNYNESSFMLSLWGIFDHLKRKKAISYGCIINISI